jgi:hypothetical protein
MPKIPVILFLSQIFGEFDPVAEAREIAPFLLDGTPVFDLAVPPPLPASAHPKQNPALSLRSPPNGPRIPVTRAIQAISSLAKAKASRDKLNRCSTMDKVERS